MNLSDTIIKIIKSFKPIEAKTQIKNPVINYKSPTNYVFQKFEMDKSQFETLVSEISSKIIETITKALDS